jgi:hypothetical protein
MFARTRVTEVKTGILFQRLSFQTKETGEAGSLTLPRPQPSAGDAQGNPKGNKLKHEKATRLKTSFQDFLALQRLAKEIGMAIFNKIQYKKSIEIGATSYAGAPFRM